MSSFKTLLGGRIHIIQVTIPDNTALPVSLYHLLTGAGVIAPTYAEISGLLADGVTSRPAFRLASPCPGQKIIQETDFSTHGITKSAGESFTTPPATSLDFVFIRSITSSPIVAQFLAIEGL
jgi:hypothetical protein